MLPAACDAARSAGIDRRTEIHYQTFEPSAILVPLVFSFFPWIICAAVTGHLGPLRPLLSEIAGVLGLGLLLFAMSCVMWNYYRSSEGLLAGFVEIARSHVRYLAVLAPVLICCGLIAAVFGPIVVGYAAIVISIASGSVLPRYAPTEARHQ